MPFKPKLFQEKFQNITGRNPTDLISSDLEDYNALSTPKQKAGFVKKTMEELLQKVPEEQLNQIMQECGKHCIQTSTIKKAKQLYEGSIDLPEFLRKLNEQHIGGGNLYLKGDIVMGGYNRCYCDSVSKAKGDIPINYCHCSTGWYKKLFEEVLGKSVRVEILESIASGADRCLFSIQI
jgi:predicted hydrocarbon binding protein